MPPLPLSMQEPWGIGELLTLATTIADGLASLHDRGIVHRAITADDIAFDRSTGEVTFPVLGTDRTLDERDDLAALGDVFHQLLTGQSAGTAPLPERVPTVLANIVLRLRAEDPDQRYQTAAGLAHDLHRAKRAWDENARIDPFPLASRDRLRHLRLARRHYGRGEALRTMRDAQLRTAHHGGVELVLIAGDPGIGKSALVSALEREGAVATSRFATGKYEQYTRDIPFATIASALTSLVLDHRDVVLSLGTNARIAVELVPALAERVRADDPLPDASPAEAKLRAFHVLAQLLAAFATASRPLTLFLDDLQWADSATLEFLRYLLAEARASHLLVVGAYRHGEVSAPHPLTQLLADVRGPKLHEISLGPLSSVELAQLLSDALQLPRAEVAGLAALVTDKSGGNPLFATQLVTALVDAAHITFDGQRWTWDLEQLQTQGLADDIVALILERLRRLPEDLRDALALVACIGHGASTSLIAHVLHEPASAVEARFAPAVTAGLVTRVDAGFTFVHDRVQEAAYALVTDAARPALHLRIARALVTMGADRLYDIVTQYHLASALVTDPDEQRQMIELHLDAARRAKAAGAYAAALGYATFAMRQLGDAGWRDATALAFAASFIAAECTYATGHPAAAEQQLVEIATRVDRAEWLAEIARTRAEVAFASGRPDRAVAISVDYLTSIGIAWPAQPSEAELRGEYARFVAAIPAGGIAAFASLPPMTDRKTIATMDVLLACLSGAGVLPDRSVHDFTVLRMANLSIEGGNGRASPIAFSRTGMVFAGRYEDWARASELADLSRTLAERPAFAYQRARVLTTVGAMLLPWSEPLEVCRPLVERAHRVAVETGDVAFSVISLNAKVTLMILGGDHLPTTAQTIEQHRAFIEKARFAMMLPGVDIQAQYVAELRGEPFTPLSDVVLRDPRHAIFAAQHWMRATALGLLFGDLASALDAIPKAKALQATCATYAQTGEFEFHAALVYAKLGDREAMRPHAVRVERWARGGSSYEPRWHVLVAEEARLDARHDDAELHYEAAIEGARRAALPNVEGIALERAAELYDQTGRPTLAAELRRQARACWRQWGAHGILARRAPEEAVPPAPVSSLDELDVTTMVAMAHAVSSELVIEKLVTRLMSLALEHAGASRAALILPERGELTVVAEATTSGGTAMRAHTTPIVDEPLPVSVLRYVSRTHESVIVDDALGPHPYASDPYLAARRARALLALPLVTGDRLTGILYLENDLTSHVFTDARLGVLRLFVSQAAIALENARLFSALRRAEQYRLEAQRLSNTGSFSWNVATDEVHWSEQLYAIYEYPADTVITPLHFVQRVHPDDREIAGTLRGTRSIDLEIRIVMPSGRLKHVQIVAHTGASGQLAGAVVDITERRLAEQKLRDAQHRFSVTVASIADGVIAADATGAITYMNPVAERLTGVRHDEVAGALVSTVTARARDVEIEQSQLADAGGTVVVLKDMTQRRRADEAVALAAANHSLQVALRGSDIGVWELDYRDPALRPPPFHTINFWESLGWEAPPEATGAGTMYRPERFHAGDRERMYEQVARHLRGELDELHFEQRMFAPDGSWRHTIFRARCVRDQDKTPTRLVGTIVDITDRRRLEDEIRAATATAEQANRSKDEFLANVSHEIRTPMNAILGMTELTLDTSLTSEQRHWMTTVKSAADNLLVIIDELLDFSKAAANKLELSVAELSLHRQLEETLRSMVMTAQRKGVALILDIGDDVPEMLRGDATRLRQIITNLVGNAIKFTAAGEVEVIVRRVHSEEDGVILTFAVRDTGIGIAEDKFAAIFEPFTQADVSTTRQFGGTGLGLSIAMRLAALMNGRIDVESKRGKGSTFTLTAHLEVTASAPLRLQALPPNARILVVAANEAERTLFARWLRSGGMRVVTAPGGVVAMDILWDGIISKDPVQFVLADMALAASDGALLVKRIKERPVLASCHVIEAPGQLAKPFGKRELFEVIARTASATAPVTVAPASPRADRSLRILVAEDSEFNADLIRELLSRRGHEPHVVGNGHAVLTSIEQGDYHLLLLDLHMPGLDGFQVIERLRARERLHARGHLPVVALTARSRPEDREQCLAAGMDDFLGKPIRSAALWETIDRLTRARGT